MKGIAETHAQKADLQALSTCRSRLYTKLLMQVVCPFRLFSIGARAREGFKDEGAIQKVGFLDSRKAV